jgi:hypothetical protein
MPRRLSAFMGGHTTKRPVVFVGARLCAPARPAGSVGAVSLRAPFACSRGLAFYRRSKRSSRL